ncbi:hypothetical protein QR680_016927 [Steinernema hermaphroditum]|uniref:Uncharacterized protein n=1 Tax=Steinernema hermaphroditum TaxID=289476 RepID=A0AA39HDP8_9BILA|nr:hypothetical protein QR680_016927 [Steinernema hermaphroditum]
MSHRSIKREPHGPSRSRSPSVIDVEGETSTPIADFESYRAFFSGELRHLAPKHKQRAMSRILDAAQNELEQVEEAKRKKAEERDRQRNGGAGGGASRA